MAKKLSDYIFDSAWHFQHVNLHSYEQYLVLRDLCDLKKDEVVKFIGYADADNHHGIFVFTDAAGKVLEVAGDFSHDSSAGELRRALTKVSQVAGLP